MDDKSAKGETLGKRRLSIPSKERYKLGEKIDTLRQLIKHPGGTKFIDQKGYIFKYTKGSRRFLIQSKKIITKKFVTEGTVLHIEGIPNPQILYYKYLADNINYASVMYTDSGPFIYDYTKEPHEPYRRSI